MDSWIRNQEEVFGRGLNLGQQRERERIVKLLEKKLFHTVYNDGEYPAVVNQQHFAGDLIGLIKGETN